jgi:hypothetical protein
MSGLARSVTIITIGSIGAGKSGWIQSLNSFLTNKDLELCRKYGYEGGFSKMVETLHQWAHSKDTITVATPHELVFDFPAEKLRDIHTRSDISELQSEFLKYAMELPLSSPYADLTCTPIPGIRITCLERHFIGCQAMILWGIKTKRIPKDKIVPMLSLASHYLWYGKSIRNMPSDGLIGVCHVHSNKNPQDLYDRIQERNSVLQTTPGVPEVEKIIRESETHITVQSLQTMDQCHAEIMNWIVEFWDNCIVERPWYWKCIHDRYTLVFMRPDVYQLMLHHVTLKIWGCAL